MGQTKFPHVSSLKKSSIAVLCITLNVLAYESGLLAEMSLVTVIMGAITVKRNPEMPLVLMRWTALIPSFPVLVLQALVRRGQICPLTAASLHDNSWSRPGASRLSLHTTEDH